MTEPTVMTTETFVTTAGDYFSVVLGAWMCRYGWLMLVPEVLFIALGYALDDVRWMLVALMVVFIVAPMVMSFIYTYYMLTPEARRAVLSKRVEIVKGEKIRLEYVKREEDGEDETSLPSPEEILWSEVVKVRSTSRFLVYQLKGERMQFLLIPWRCMQPRLSNVKD